MLLGKYIPNTQYEEKKVGMPSIWYVQPNPSKKNNAKTKQNATTKHTKKKNESDILMETCCWGKICQALNMKKVSIVK